VELLELPYDFKEGCPLCGAKDCAEFIGYYHRGAIDEKGTYYKAFPIARYLCKGKGSVFSVKHRTFSLLPYQLVPYTKYSIPFIIRCLGKVYWEDNSVEGLLDYLAGFGAEGYIELSTSTFQAFKTFILTCIDKMLAMGFHKETESVFQRPSARQRIKVFLSFAEEFVCCKTAYEIRGPCALGYDYYLSNGGYFRNGHFLFGVPSQFR
jgi:hypothetical protein